MPGCTLLPYNRMRPLRTSWHIKSTSGKPPSERFERTVMLDVKVGIAALNPYRNALRFSNPPIQLAPFKLCSSLCVL